MGTLLNTLVECKIDTVENLEYKFNIAWMSINICDLILPDFCGIQIYLVD